MDSLGAEWKLSDCQRWSCCHSANSNELNAPFWAYMHDCWPSLLRLLEGGSIRGCRGERVRLGACCTRAGGVYPGPHRHHLNCNEHCIQDRISHSSGLPARSTLHTSNPYFSNSSTSVLLKSRQHLPYVPISLPGTPVSCGRARWPPNSRSGIISSSPTPNPFLLAMVSGNG